VIEFHYHRSLAPMMWAFVALATIELFAVHLLLSLRWPVVAWPLSLLTVASIGWVVVLIRSFERCPHTLSRDVLTLRSGRLKTYKVPRSDIAGIRSTWNTGEHAEDDTANLALIAHPHRIIDLNTPMIGKRGLIRRIAIALDDPAAFDTALRS
jgi:hypothetical protein